jgi:hypothetical protein
VHIPHDQSFHKAIHKSGCGPLGGYCLPSFSTLGVQVHRSFSGTSSMMLGTWLPHPHQLAFSVHVKSASISRCRVRHLDGLRDAQVAAQFARTARGAGRLLTHDGSCFFFCVKMQIRFWAALKYCLFMLLDETAMTVGCSPSRNGRSELDNARAAHPELSLPKIGHCSCMSCPT